MPLIGVSCSHCGHVANVSDAFIGRSILCAECKTSFTVARPGDGAGAPSASPFQAPNSSSWRPVNSGPAAAPMMAPPTGPAPGMMPGPQFGGMPNVGHPQPGGMPGMAPAMPAPGGMGLPNSGAVRKPAAPPPSGPPPWVYAAGGVAALLLVIVVVAMSGGGNKPKEIAQQNTAPAAPAETSPAVAKKPAEKAPPVSTDASTKAAAAVAPAVLGSANSAPAAAPVANETNTAAAKPALTFSASKSDPNADPHFPNGYPAGWPKKSEATFKPGMNFLPTLAAATAAPNDDRPIVLALWDPPSPNDDMAKRKQEMFQAPELDRVEGWFAWVDVPRDQWPALRKRYKTTDFFPQMVIVTHEGVQIEVVSGNAPSLLAKLLEDVLVGKIKPKPEYIADAAAASGPATAARPTTVMALPELINFVEPSVVRIELSHGSLGSGFVVDGDGTVVTNFHVMDGGKKAVAKFANGDSVDVMGYVLALPDRDLCVIRIGQPKNPLRPALVSPAAPLKGETVAAFGSPLGLGFTATKGVVSAIRPCKELKADIGSLHHADDMTWIQTDVSISGGNSGGPLANERGEVIGVNTMSLVGANAQNLNFAVSCLDVTKAIADARGKPVLPLASLPKGPDKHVASSTPEGAIIGLPPAMTLPSGRLIDIRETFGIDLEWTTEKLLEKYYSGGRLLKMEYPSGKTQGVLCARSGQLDGPALASYENGRPMVYGNYQQGKRHGNLIIWDEGAKPRLLAQYAEGKKYGICVFLEKGEVKMIEEYDKSVLKAVHLIRNGHIVSSFNPPPPPTPGSAGAKPAAAKPATGTEPETPAEPKADDPELADLMTKLDEVEQTMADNEKLVKAWVRKNSR